MYDLTGKVALVTGAGRGIGRAIALRLAREGADVAAVDVDARALDELAADVKGIGRRVVTARVDVTKSAEVEQFVRRVVDELGPVDILVNNAGITRIVPLLDMAENDWDAL